MGASGLAAMNPQTGTGWIDQWYRAKYGRATPMEEARLRAEQATVAYRGEVAAAAKPATNFETLWRVKYGRSSPMEEARLRAEQGVTAYREEAVQLAPPADIRTEEFWRAKLGRPAGK
jgi:hypothetical protein